MFAVSEESARLNFKVYFKLFKAILIKFVIKVENILGKYLYVLLAMI